MLKNFLTIALRQLGKHKLFSFIKIGGFALGVAACLLITLYMRHELSYEKAIPGVGRIYRLLAQYDDSGKMFPGTAFSAPIAKTLKAEFPQIELAGRLMPYPLFGGAGSNQVRPEGRVDNTYEEGFAFADQSLIDILHLPLVYGDRAHALADPNTLIMSRRKAEKFFPHQNPVGKLIYLNNDIKNPWRVGAVMENTPTNTHLQYDYYLSLTGHELWPNEQNTWMANNYDAYIKLQPGATAAEMEGRIKDMLHRQLLPVYKESGLADAEKLVKSIGISLQPMTDIHLNAEVGDSHTHGDRRFVHLFAAVAGFILLLACINFVNLSTARSAGRAREVGLRKVVGSRRQGLIRQFLLESLVLSFFSFLLAIVLAWLLLPLFNRMSGTSLRFPWGEWWLFPTIIVSSIVIGLLAGIYPSVYLSSFKPVEVLKGNLSLGTRNSSLRSVLVVFQFTTSIILIIATFVIKGQMDFMLHRKLGFDKNQVIQIQGVSTLDKEMRTFRSELMKVPGISYASLSDFLPVEGSKRNMNTLHNAGKQKEEAGVGTQVWNVDHYYIPAMSIQMVAGRNFAEDILSDSGSIIINEAMAAKLQLKDPIDHLIARGNKNLRIIGVMKNFNFESMKQDIGPLCFVIGGWANTISIKINAAETKEVLARVAALWKSFSPHQDFRYVFMDESFARMYANVQRTGLLFTSFAVLAIIIACLGLFALASFMAEQRSREIGIRKVLGATVAQMASLLSMNFVRLVVIAFVIAAPIAWWAMHSWLKDFAYRIDIDGWIFAAAGGLTILIALLTISFQAMRTAMTNPARSLRSE